MRTTLLAVLFAGATMLAACKDEKPSAAAGAGDLQAIMDSVMPRLQVVAGLQRKAPIQMQKQPRDSLRRYIESRMQEELPPEELEAIRQVYVTLGLIPAELDLRALLLDLYTEQVVGYYDPATKKLFVVDGVPVEQVRPVLVHELVHALQDQHTDLDSLISRARGNDRQSAAQAAIEGHATVVMFALLAEEQAGAPVDPRQLPDIGEQIRPSMEAQNEQFPVFQKAPRILRETMLFPYAGGASFVQKLWRVPLESGFGDPYPAPINDRLPQSTEQILHPEQRFLAGRDDPTTLRLESGSGGRTIRENTLGELETAVLLEQHLGADRRRDAQGWDGDIYRLIDAGGKRALIWFSIWDDAGSADRFAAAYRAVAAKRTGRNISVERIDIDGRPGVRIIDADAGFTPAAATLPAVRIAV